jgi:serine/threonine protein kinase
MTDEEMYCAYGFNTFIQDPDECFDVPLPEPFEDYDVFSNTLKLGKIHKKGENGTIAYKYTYENISELYDTSLTQVHTPKTHKITDYIGKHFTRTYDSFSPDINYLVKAIVAPTYRDMVTGLKEATINHEIYISVNHCDSISVVCKPYFCMPYWDGKKWLFLIATEFAEGKNLSQYWYLVSRFSATKRIIKDLVDKSVHTLWWLGFSHNNLKKTNIIYDKKLNTVKLIGLSKSVVMPHNKVMCFRNNMVNFVTSFQEQYELVFREESINLTSLTYKYGKKDTDNETIKTDDFILSANFF